LHNVVSKGVVVVDHQQHGVSNLLNSDLKTAFRSLARRALHDVGRSWTRRHSGISNRQGRQSDTDPAGPAEKIQARQRQRACALMT